ncbi:MAG: SDR family NAD(P)-dependent oxidoreductase [Bacteriovoracaceae bacterium]|jgi:short-subunit dehydrogenase|nr:SDR family NAD(P)-dependent oxidoreductase [Bacteriovoracaceae bacterium]
MNKVALITGASSGIGESLAYEYAQNGFNLILAARRIEKLNSLKEEIEKKYAVKVLVGKCDVGTRPDLDNLVKRGVEEFGRIDTVIANAGFGVLGLFESLTTEDFKRQFDTNVYGVLNTIYSSLEELKKTKGKICLIGSTFSYITSPTSSAYSMSKYAIRALAETIWAEFIPLGISVTLICPGFIRTEIRKISNSNEVTVGAKDPVPEWMMMSSVVAARKIRKAVEKRKKQKILTVHSALGIYAGKYFQWLLDFFFWIGAKLGLGMPEAEFNQ